MIERLPLDLFGDESDRPEAAAPAEDVVVEDEPAPAPVVEAPPEADIVLATCQWCSESFDNDLSACPQCNAIHIKAAQPDVVETTVTCQWCLTEFDIGPTHCPTCNARVVVPGQHVLGEHDLSLDYNRLGVLGQRAHSRQLLAGMMIGGGLDIIAGGLIGLAITLLDDD